MGGKAKRDCGKAKNIEKSWVFCGFLHFLEARKGCLRHLGGCLGRFRNIFGHVGDKMASKRDKMATKRANMATKSAKMSENEARDCCKSSASVTRVWLN